MQNRSETPNQAAPAVAGMAQAEAAHYAVLRRITPTIRHHLVGEFQPIGMIATMLDRRLQSDEPNLNHLRDNSAALGKLSRTAASTCMNLMSWLAPKKDAVTKLDSGVVDCLSLLTTEFRFRGFVLVNEVTDMPVNVSTAALRSVLPAALLAMSDQQPGPADFALKADLVPHGVALSIVRRSAVRSAETSPVAEYRALNWQDVTALAQAESVGFSQSADAVQLTFSKASPAPHLTG
jgi:hypothetical protein